MMLWIVENLIPILKTFNRLSYDKIFIIIQTSKLIPHIECILIPVYLS